VEEDDEPESRPTKAKKPTNEAINNTLHRSFPATTSTGRPSSSRATAPTNEPGRKAPTKKTGAKATSKSPSPPGTNSNLLSLEALSAQLEDVRRQGLENAEYIRELVGLVATNEEIDKKRRMLMHEAWPAEIEDDFLFN